MNMNMNMKNDTATKPGRPKTANPKSGAERTRSYRARVVFTNPELGAIKFIWGYGSNLDTREAWDETAWMLEGIRIWTMSEAKIEELRFLIGLADVRAEMSEGC